MGASGFVDWQSFEIPIHRRKFSDSYENVGHYELTGTISKSGDPTGTIHLTTDAFGGDPPCDSGVLNWTASKGG